MDQMQTIKKRAEFLAHLRETCNVGKSAKAVGIGRSTVYQWRKEDENFAAQIDEAKRDAIEALEDEVHRRAFEGSLVITKNGTYTQYSDTLAIFLLKAHAPERYMDKVRSELTGAGGAPLELSDAQIAAKLDAIGKAAMARAFPQGATPEVTAPEDDFSDLV